MFPTLEELARVAQPLDLAEFGLKTEGLLELIRAKDIFRKPGSELHDFSYDVPPGFVVPKSADLADLTDLDHAYAELTKGEPDYAAFLARSSHEDEQPGEFQTIAFLYDPRTPQENLARMHDAVQKVRASPAKAVVVQRMGADVVYTRTEPKTLLRVPLFDDALDFDTLAAQLRSSAAGHEVHEYDARVAYGTRVLSTGFTFPRRGCEAATDGNVLREFLMRKREFFSDDSGYGSMNHDARSLTDIERVALRVEFTADIVPAEPQIGACNTGIVARSHSHIDPSDAVLTACVGLPTKLVDSPDEICIVSYRLPFGWRSPVSTGNRYTSESFYYHQGDMDVFDVTLGQITSVPTPSTEALAPFQGFQAPAGIREQAYGIIDVLMHFSKKYGTAVEIEGMIDTRKDRLVLFQLTKSYLLENVLAELTRVAPAQQIWATSARAIGSIRFSGDVVVYTGSKDDDAQERRLRKTLERCPDKSGVLLLTPNFRDDVLSEFGITNYVTSSSRSTVLRRDLGQNRTPWAAAHVQGYLTSQNHKRRRQGHNVCSLVCDDDLQTLIEKDLGIYDRRRAAGWHKDVATLHDVSVEATKGDFQMYFNAR